MTADSKLTWVGGSGPGVCSEHVALGIGGRNLGSGLPAAILGIAVNPRHSGVQRRVDARRVRCAPSVARCARSVAQRAPGRHSCGAAQRSASKLHMSCRTLSLICLLPWPDRIWLAKCPAPKCRMTCYLSARSPARALAQPGAFRSKTCQGCE